MSVFFEALMYRVWNHEREARIPLTGYYHDVQKAEQARDEWQEKLPGADVVVIGEMVRIEDAPLNLGLISYYVGQVR